jgi:hypothetical protein
MPNPYPEQLVASRLARFHCGRHDRARTSLDRHVTYNVAA